MALLVEPASAQAFTNSHLTGVEVALWVGITPLEVALAADGRVLTAAAAADLCLKWEVRMACCMECAIAAALAAEERP